MNSQQNTATTLRWIPIMAVTATVAAIGTEFKILPIDGAFGDVVLGWFGTGRPA